MRPTLLVLAALFAIPNATAIYEANATVLETESGEIDVGPGIVCKLLGDGFPTCECEPPEGAPEGGPLPVAAYEGYIGIGKPAGNPDSSRGMYFEYNYLDPDGC